MNRLLCTVFVVFMSVPPVYANTIEIPCTMTNKRHVHESYQDYVWFDLTCQTQAFSTPMRALKGVLRIQDLFEEDVMRLNYVMSETVKPGVPFMIKGVGYKYNQFMEDHRHVRTMEVKDIKVVFEVRQSIPLSDDPRTQADPTASGPFVSGNHSPPPSVKEVPSTTPERRPSRYNVPESQRAKWRESSEDFR